MNDSRRSFLKKSLITSGGIALGSMYGPSFASARSGANEKILVGLVGCRNHGFNILKHHMNNPEVECIALCDVDQNVLDERTADVEKIQGKKPKQYNDYRKFLENKDLDAVIIGTPDHWHCLIMVAACEAGKHVYVEKPMANSIGECDIMVNAAKKYKTVVQVGQQQRSGKIWKNITDLIKEDGIGTLRKIKVWGNFHYGIGNPVVPDSPVPEGVDFDMWLGPAPDRSFNASRFHGKWRMFWDYGGGLMTDWGVHLLDMALWAADIKTAPEKVASFGGNFSFPGYAHETPDTLSVNYKVNDLCLTWDHVAGTQNGPYDKLYGIAFTGDSGTIVANREGWELKPEYRDDRFVRDAIPYREGKNYHAEHVRNFLDSIKGDDTVNCDVETGRLAAIYAHLGNMAIRTDSTLSYNEKTQKFEDNREADKLLLPEYRSPWKLPEV